MTTQKKAKKLAPDQVTRRFDPGGLAFDDTAELEPLDGIIGQPRAMKALDVGLGIGHATYNIYVAGMNGTGKKETIRRMLDERVTGTDVPPDWLYLNNFDHPDCPIAVDLSAGDGKRLRQDMEDFIRGLGEELPKALQKEDFNREKQSISRTYDEESQELFRELDKQAREKGLTVQQMPDGSMNLVPVKEDRPMTREEFEELSEEEQSEISDKQRDLAQHVDKLVTGEQRLRRRLTEKVRKVERDFATRIVAPGVEALKRDYPNEKLGGWLDRVENHILDNLSKFVRPQEEQKQAPVELPGMPARGSGDGFTEYRVNVVVDNGGLDKAPVVIEDAPNYKNLFGTTGSKIDRPGQAGGNAAQIRSGSLLRANGGFLVLNLVDALVEPLVWKELKRCIKSGKMEFHAYDPLGVFAAADIRPEPIPLQVKLVALGNPLVYHLLHLHDEDFSDIFKVKADFDSEMDVDGDTGVQLGRFVRKLSGKEDLLPFTAAGVAELAHAAVRLAGHKNRMTAEFSRLADVIREADYWARSDGVDKIDPRHVRRAADEKVYRSNLVAEKIRELIRDGVLLIDVEGRVVGQLNGLSVINLGDYRFGRPSRITASAGVGNEGLVNIERESKLSGQTYDKAVLILEGYLRNTYAADHPLTLSAGIALEQSYGSIEGDSASVAELVCLLSAIAGVPLRQDIAITGSVNQWGQVQAVGGINEKIEGFFDVCRELGAGGTPGVCIPAANVRHLVLRPDVVDAVRSGDFSVWSISHVDQALNLLGDIEAGDPESADTFHGAVDARLVTMGLTLRDQQILPGERTSVSVTPPGSGRPDPRPPMPVDEPVRDPSGPHSRETGEDKTDG